MTPQPPLEKVLEAARVAREQGKLVVARRALEHVYGRLEDIQGVELDAVAQEAELLGKEMAVRGAPLAALGEWTRAHELGRPQAKNLHRLAEHYARWRPEPASIGVSKDALTAGGSGAFWVGLGQQGRILTLAGGITGAGTESFRRVLGLAAKKVQWLFLDVEQLTYVGSAGLAVIVKTAERLRSGKQGNGRGGVVLFSLSSNLKLLVETLGLAKSLHPVSDLESALELALRERAASQA